jgi:hypothetical protein
MCQFSMSIIERDAIPRANLFISLAKGCPFSQRNEHEAFLESAVIYGRTALLRIETEYENRVGWKEWWGPLLRNKSVKFLQDERNTILHECPPKVNQVIHMGAREVMAADCYYYGDDPNIRAVDTVETHVIETERLVHEGRAQFKNVEIVPEYAFVGISVFWTASLILMVRRLRDLCIAASHEKRRAANSNDEAARVAAEADESCYAIAAILPAGAGLEAVLSEYAYITDMERYKKKSFRMAGIAEKYRKLKHLDFTIEHPDAESLSNARKALAHSEPDARRSRFVGERINALGATWAAETLENFTVRLWEDALPDWIRNDIGLVPI